jgi:hypothetical protein
MKNLRLVEELCQYCWWIVGVSLCCHHQTARVNRKLPVLWPPPKSKTKTAGNTTISWASCTKHTVPQHFTLNLSYYSDVLHTVLQHFRWKPQKWRKDILHHGNAHPYMSHVVSDFLQRKGLRIVPHPPYSPN